MQYLQGLNIFVIMELTGQLQPVCLDVSYEASDVMMLVSLFFQRAHLWPFEKP
jgi:hypothetical protein